MLWYLLLCVSLATCCELTGKSVAPSSAKSLQLVHSPLEALEHSCFQDYPSLTALYLYDNRIRHVAVDAFAGLHELRHLDLSHNNIVTLDPDTFQENPKLVSLTLRDNPLAVTSSPILASDSINNLDLSDCNLTSLNTRYFSGIPNLEKLNLRHNSLTQLPGDFFTELSKLRRVYLHGNPWRCDVMADLLLGNQDIIADYKKIQCVTPVAMETSTQQPATVADLSSEDLELPEVEDYEFPEVEESDLFVIESDVGIFFTDDVETVWEDNGDVKVVEGKQDGMRTAMVHMNIVLVVVVSLLLVAIVLVVVKQSYVSLREARVRGQSGTHAESGECEGENDGYLIPVKYNTPCH